MSGSNSSGSSSAKWDDLLKHGSALSILKPDVVFSPYGSSSSSSGSSSNNTSGSSGSNSSSRR
ncbi:hypothetical protein QBC42DRAFT_285679 [Cladorrhinum samala]|uniref:Uncharacterized protein n=1 Tax=Cladorrhinum samala TaxID=585594 RepID=A0AAV9HR46_9PEZI|nr:hypothetical protein QBC42DRAFT_285679 [Cladorrhinum samala]